MLAGTWLVSRQELDNVDTTVVARLCRCQLSVADAVSQIQG